jgi:hypothetical protein
MEAGTSRSGVWTPGTTRSPRGGMGGAVGALPLVLASRSAMRWHRLYLRPDPHQHGALAGSSVVVVVTPSRVRRPYSGCRRP